MWEEKFQELRGGELWPSWDPLWVKPRQFRDDDEEADLQSGTAQTLMKTAMTKQTVCGCGPAAAVGNVWFSSEAKKNITISKAQL